MTVTYKDAGVDLEVYRDAMARLPRLMHRTFSPRVMKLDGGFAGLFRLDFQGSLFNRRYQDPVLVSCTDGVGTKLKVAQRLGIHHTVGIDLVAMCVNDAICCGAEPLFFNDYIAMPKDNPEILEQLVAGISDGCLTAGCALNSGETAIMPELYADGDYDLAGFCVGVADQADLIDGRAIAPGDCVLGLASSGLHSNGFSLVRRVVFDIAQLETNARVAELDATVGEELLKPTRIYVRPLQAVLHHHRKTPVVHGVAHITGGGLHENLSRILPANCRAEIQRDSWTIPPVFSWLQQLGKIREEEMYRVFNMGIGLVLVVSQSATDSVQQILTAAGVTSWPIGTITEGGGDADWARADG